MNLDRVKISIGCSVFSPLNSSVWDSIGEYVFRSVQFSVSSSMHPVLHLPVSTVTNSIDDSVNDFLERYESHAIKKDNLV